jgi:hypothetical protein
MLVFVLQLLEGARLPPLRTSKHFVNLTNGLEMAPLLQQLQLPFRCVQTNQVGFKEHANVRVLVAAATAAAKLAQKGLHWVILCFTQHVKLHLSTRSRCLPAARHYPLPPAAHLPNRHLQS